MRSRDWIQPDVLAVSREELIVSLKGDIDSSNGSLDSFRVPHASIRYRPETPSTNLGGINTVCGLGSTGLTCNRRN